MNIDIEYANAAPQGTRRRLELAFRGAPPEIRRSVGLPPYPGKASQPALEIAAGGAKAPSRKAQPSKRVQEALAAIRKGHIGWISGCVAPGVSLPCYSSADRQQFPEQFTGRAWQSIVEQLSDKASTVPLVWRHGGQVVAQGVNELRLRKHPHLLVGVTFEARLRGCTQSEIALDAIGAGGCGVSIGYRKAKQWQTERPGVGTVRVVDDCTVDHIALVPTGEGRGPAYPAARAYAARSKSSRCPTELASEAESFAWQEIKTQLKPNL